MTRQGKPLASEQIAKVKDEDIDFSKIPELDETFRREAELVEHGPTDRIAVRGRRSPR